MSMSLIKRLLLIAAGFVAAFYALGVGPSLSPVRMTAVLANPTATPKLIGVILVVVAIATALTAIVNTIEFLSDKETTKVSYTRVIWTTGLFIASSALFGMLLEPNIGNLLAWVLAAPGMVQIAAGIILLLPVLTIFKILATIGAAVDEFYAKSANTSHPLKEDIETIQDNIDTILKELGWTEDSNNEWHPPKTTISKKLLALLDSQGYTLDTATGKWVPPENGVGKFKDLHERLDELFAFLKRNEESNNALAAQVAAISRHVGMAKPEESAAPNKAAA